MHKISSDLITSTPGRKVTTFILEQLSDTSRLTTIAENSVLPVFFTQVKPLIITAPALYKLFFGDSLNKALGFLDSEKEIIEHIVDKCLKWNSSSYNPFIPLEEILSKSFDHLTKGEAKSIAQAFINSENKFREAGKTIVISGISYLNPLLGMAIHIAGDALKELSALPVDGNLDYAELIRQTF